MTEELATLSEPVKIEVGTSVLFYDFDNLCLHQKELAVEVYRFKLEQTKKNPPKFEAVLASGGAEYKLRCLSYLFVTLDKDSVPQSFSRSKSEDVFRLVCQIKGSDNDHQCERVLSDFFIRRGVPELQSDAQEISSLDVNAILQSAMSQMVSLTPESKSNSETLPGSQDDSSSRPSLNGD